MPPEPVVVEPDVVDEAVVDDADVVEPLVDVVPSSSPSSEQAIIEAHAIEHINAKRTLMSSSLAHSSSSSPGRTSMAGTIS